MNARTEGSADAQFRELLNGRDGVRRKIEGPMEGGVQSGLSNDRHRGTTRLVINAPSIVKESDDDACGTRIGECGGQPLEGRQLRRASMEDLESGTRFIARYRHLLEQHGEFRRIWKRRNLIPYSSHHLR